MSAEESALDFGKVIRDTPTVQPGFIFSTLKGFVVLASSNPCSRFERSKSSAMDADVQYDSKIRHYRLNFEY
jgi:hypothetical protein